jgi:type IV pilus assembly protein PilA
MQKQKGFSLIELLIVVAIILIIAAIAIPNLLRARISANEASAVGSVRTINTAQITYNSSYSTVGYASSLTNLAGTSCAPPTSGGACLIDSQLGSGAASTKSGYSFGISGATGTPVATYSIIAAPISPNQTGTRYFCSFADAVVRFSPTTAITTCDYSVSPLNQ